MTKFEIKNWKTGSIIYSGEGSSLAKVVERAVKEGVSLAYADLTEARLSGVDLSWADLSYANLTDADFSYINLTRSNLTKIIFSKNTNIYWCNLTEVDFSEVVFT